MLTELKRDDLQKVDGGVADACAVLGLGLAFWGFCYEAGKAVGEAVGYATRK